MESRESGRCLGILLGSLRYLAAFLGSPFTSGCIRESPSRASRRSPSQEEGSITPPLRAVPRCTPGLARSFYAPGRIYLSGSREGSREGCDRFDDILAFWEARPK